jgi:hypothetical protein
MKRLGHDCEPSRLIGAPHEATSDPAPIRQPLVDNAAIDGKYNGFFEKSIFFREFFEIVVNFARQ